MQAGTPAHFFDGLTAGRHDVFVALSEDRAALIISGDSLPEPLRWRLIDLRALSDGSDQKRLTVTRHAETDDEAPRDPARLVVLDEDLVAWLRKTRPDLFKKDVRPGTLKTVGKYAAGAVAAAGIMLFVILPAMANTLALIIPMEREIAFGKTVVRQVEWWLQGGQSGDLRCTSVEGEAALAKMLNTLTDPHDMQYVVDLQVFDTGMVNAFAAPGGQVVILRGLLDMAEHPDEVAGVLAHEIGHVESRDATRNTLRVAGSAGILTMLLGDFTGGAAIATFGERALSASYTREAERAADQFALNMLSNANVSSAGFARFFDELHDEMHEDEDDGPNYLATHPAAVERAQIARDHAAAQGVTTPVLTDVEWQALKEICE